MPRSPLAILPVHAAPSAVVVCLLCAGPVHAQELGIPAVDDAPSLQLLVDQAGDQARANPREAVRLLLQALDGGPQRLVRSASSPDLFVPVNARIHQMLRADPALRAAFRDEAGPPAAESLARDELSALVLARIDTEAGLEAALRLAQSAIAGGRFATAASLLARVEDHDLLAGRRALHHAAMQALASMRVGDSATAEAARTRGRALASDAQAGRVPGVDADEARAIAVRMGTLPAAPGAASFAVGLPGSFDPAASREWSQTWTVPLRAPLVMPSIDLGGVSPPAAPATAPRLPRPMAAPAADAERVYVDDGSGLVAVDRLSGRPAWTHGAEIANADTTDGGLKFTAVGEGSVVSFATQSGLLSRPGSGRVTCLDAASGTVRWDLRVDRMDGRTELEGLVPQGQPLIVDGLVVVAGRRATVRLESVSWIFALDLDRPRPPAWSRVLATSGSIRFGPARSSDSPVLAGGIVYMATGTGAVAAIEPGDGTIRWLRRLPVPVRDLGGRAEPWDASTPAVAGGRVFAVTPDRSRVEVLDARTGETVTSLPTGADAPIRTPAYAIGDAASGAVLLVGESVVCVDAADPATVRWAWPAVHAVTERPQGRVQLAARTGGGAPVVAVPAAADVVVLDSVGGAELLRVPAAGNANLILAGDQMIAAGARAMSSWMPIADAERVARARMAATQAAEPALALLRLARQVRRPTLAVEAAREAARRCGDGPAAEDARAELFELLLAIDAADFAVGEDRAAIDALVDQAAIACGSPVRGALARADRALRRGDPRACARIAAEAALAAPPGSVVDADGRSASIDAFALERIARAVSTDAAAAAELADAARRAVDAAPADRADHVRRTATRLVAGTPAARSFVGRAGDGSSLVLDASAAARLAQECAPAAVRPAPVLPGDATRVVQFPGRLLRLGPGAQQPAAGLLTMQGEDAVFRQAPDFAAAWRVRIGARDPFLLGDAPDIVLWDDSVPGWGVATALTPKGALRWKSPRTGELFQGLGGEFGADAPPVDVGDGRNVPGSQVIPLLADAALVLARRDGQLVGVRTADGTRGWSRGDAFRSIAAAARDRLAVALAGEGPPGDSSAVRVEVLDPATGTPFLAWNPEDANEVRWMRIDPAGLVVVATDAGIEARRLGGGDESSPYWTCSLPDARSTTRGWSVGHWILALDRFDGLLAIDARSGAVSTNAFRVPDALTLAPARDVLEGDGWLAVVRDSRVDFFAPDGRYLGRDVPSDDRTYVAAVVSRTRAFLLDSAVPSADLAGGRLGAFVDALDPASGGTLAGPRIPVRCVGQRASALAVIDGWLFASNGSVIQALDFRTGATGRR
jgi:outer membrane protein assembly factor BamB